MARCRWRAPTAPTASRSPRRTPRSMNSASRESTRRCSPAAPVSTRAYRRSSPAMVCRPMWWAWDPSCRYGLRKTPFAIIAMPRATPTTRFSVDGGKPCWSAACCSIPARLKIYSYRSRTPTRTSTGPWPPPSKSRVCCGLMSDAKPERPLTLGVDLRTSAVKVVALGADDAVMGEGVAGFGTDSSLPHQAEQQPTDWLRAASAAMHALADDLQGSLAGDWTEHVAAIGLTGQLPTLVCLDDVKPVGAAITWKDGRADAWASARVDTARRTLMYARTGMPI